MVPWPAAFAPPWPLRIEAVRIDLSKGMVEVTARSGASLDAATLKQTLRDAGYDVRRIDRVATGAASAGKIN